MAKKRFTQKYFFFCIRCRQTRFESLSCLVSVKVTIFYTEILMRLFSLTVGLPEIWNILEIQKMEICSEVPNLWGKWISGWNVQKSADYWDTQFFLFSQKFHDQSFLPNCEIIEPGTTFLEISLDSAYSIDSKNGLTFENR